MRSLRSLISRLEELRSSCGPEWAPLRAELIKEVEDQPLTEPEQLLRYHEILMFARAHPDNEEVLELVDHALAGFEDRVSRVRTHHRGELPEELVDSGLAGTENGHTYSHSMVRDLVKYFPGDLEIDWDAIEDSSDYFDTLNLGVLPAEVPGVDDEWIDPDEWLRAARGTRLTSDLKLLLTVLDTRPWPEPVRAALYDRLKLKVRWRLKGPLASRTRAIRRPRPAHFHAEPLERDRFDLAERVRKPIPEPRRLRLLEARRIMAWMKSSMSVRNRELYPLCHPDPADAWEIPIERGITIYMFGVQPVFRLLIEALHGYFLVKNGVPVGYALSSVAAGECEIGINIFDTFRGGETALLYADLMRIFHHRLGAEYFFVPRRQIGYEMEEGIESGAYWFYDKLGFRSTDPALRAVADRERQRIGRKNSYRSPEEVLKALAVHDMYFTLDPARRPEDQLSHGRLGMAVTQWVNEAHHGGRKRAMHRTRAEAIRRLGLTHLEGWSPPQRDGFERLAPLVMMIPDWSAWKAAERKALVEVIRAKGGVSEREYALLTKAHTRWVAFLRQLARGCAKG